ncbi:hypothetical protein ACFJIX_17950 [Roseateles sp. UC29_93]|uniref:hypothetical protein n=1 Tax=Roseateles sp. UC29_93 TaxID=3350177 RepID=UPI00366D8E3C
MRNVSEAAISKAVSAGKITVVNGLIHPDLADAQWYTTSRAAKAAGLAGVTAPTPPAASVMAMPTPEGDGKRQRVDDELWKEMKRDDARRAKAEADKAEMQAAQMAGRLLEADGFLQALTDVAAALGAALERVPDKLSERLAAQSSAIDCHRLLSQELLTVREDVVKALERMAADVGRLRGDEMPEAA